MEDEGWDEDTQELVSDIFQMAGDASLIMSEVYRKLALLKGKVRQETFLRVANSIPLPITNLTVVSRDESDQGLDVNKERIRDHMPTPAHFEGMDTSTKLLGALVHYLMRNNLCRTTNTYAAKKATRDFNVGYTALKRVISGVKQKGGSAYKRMAQEDPDTPPSSKKQRPNPVDQPTGEQEPVEVVMDKLPCKYCGKKVTADQLSQHINDQHPGRQTVYACPYCTQPFNQYRLFLEHIKGNHFDKIIKCKTCGEVFRNFFQLKNHAKVHINQCPFCSDNFSTAAELEEHMEQKHAEDPDTVERQCSLCAATYSAMEDLVSHMQEVHRPYAYNVNELHEHMRSVHWSKMKYRCNKCPAVFKAFSGLDKHHEKSHDRARVSGVMVDLPCPKCSRTFKDVTMFINHSRDHEENQYECEECRWCFESYARLHGHCRSTHDMMKFSCDTCGEDFNNNEDLYRRAKCKHIQICHVCRSTFVSESELQVHLEEVHGEKTPRTREQMIKDEQAEDRLEKQRRKEKKKKKKKRKRKHNDDEDDHDDDDKDEDETYHPSQDYGDDSTVDPEYRPTKKQLKDADREGDR